MSWATPFFFLSGWERGSLDVACPCPPFLPPPPLFFFFLLPPFPVSTLTRLRVWWGEGVCIAFPPRARSSPDAGGSRVTHTPLPPRPPGPRFSHHGVVDRPGGGARIMAIPRWGHLERSCETPTDILVGAGATQAWFWMVCCRVTRECPHGKGKKAAQSQRTRGPEAHGKTPWQIANVGKQREMIAWSTRRRRKTRHNSPMVQWSNSQRGAVAARRAPMLELEAAVHHRNLEYPPNGL